MAYFTKSVFLNSVKVSKDLLVDLRNIFEEDFNNETTKIEADFNRKVKEQTEEINKSTISEKEKNALISEITGMTYKKSHRIRVSYSIDASEQINYDSMDEIIKSTILPEGVQRMNLSCTGSPEIVSVVIYLPTGSIVSNFRYCTISSSNRSSLLKIEEQIKEVFRKHRTNYSWFFTTPYTSFLLALLIIILLEGLFIIHNTLFNSRNLYGALGNFFIILIFSLAPALFVDYLLGKIFPYFSFELGGSKPPRLIFTGIMSIILLGLLTTFIYNLIHTLSLNNWP